jgi:hypothetical protein
MNANSHRQLRRLGIGRLGFVERPLHARVEFLSPRARGAVLARRGSSVLRTGEPRAREGSARTTWAYSSRSSRRQRSPGPPKVLALAAYPVWPSRSLARAHWRTIRSHTDIWDPDDPVQTIATNTGRLARL